MDTCRVSSGVYQLILDAIEVDLVKIFNRISSGIYCMKMLDGLSSIGVGW